MLSSKVDSTLTSSKGKVLDVTKPDQNVESVVLGTNYKATGGLLLLVETAKMMDKAMGEKAEEANQP